MDKWSHDRCDAYFDDEGPSGCESCAEIDRLRAEIERLRSQMLVTLDYLGRLRHGGRPSPTELLYHWKAIRDGLQGEGEG